MKPFWYSRLVLMLGGIATAQNLQYKESCPTPVEPFAFVSVTPGKFTMGSPDGEIGHEDNERQREVTLTKPYQIQTTEVTQGLWEKVMGNNPSFFKDENLPVETVSWNEVQSFVKKLNALNNGGGYHYRLPTEAEWEYAVRGGNSISSTDMQTAYFFGNDPIKLSDFAWFSGNSENKTKLPATRGKNALGLYDGSGNVWEWVQDLYVEDTSKLPTTDPVNETSGSERVFRGGSWNNSAESVRSAYRGYDTPISRYNDIGFRLVRTRK